MNPHDGIEVPDHGNAAWADNGTIASRPPGVEPEADASTRIASWIATDAADSLIQQIFAVKLKLESWAQLINGPAPVQLVAAFDDLDAIIAEVREAVSHELSTGDRAPLGPTGSQGREANINEIIDQLPALALNLSDLRETASADGQAIQLINARHSLYRAFVDLTGVSD